MLNLGGPEKSEDAGEFMRRMFLDKQIAGTHPIIANLIKKFRGPKVAEKYDVSFISEQIGDWRWQSHLRVD